MKTYSELITEMSKSEENILKLFTSKDQEVEIVYFTGSGRIRGAKATAGKREYETALKMIKNGKLKSVKKDIDTFTKKVVVKLGDGIDVDTSLGADEQLLYDRIKDWETNPKRKNFRKLSSAENKAFNRLKNLGYVSGYPISPEIVK